MCTVLSDHPLIVPLHLPLQDCASGWDERSDLCSPDPCAPHQFLCTGDALCIDDSLLCNGFTECVHGEDEQGCGGEEGGRAVVCM